VRALALPLAFFAFHGSAQPLPAPVRAEIVHNRYWHSGCPVSLSHLRLLTVTYWGFDKRPRSGQLVVNANAASGVLRVFRRLYELRFPIRQMTLEGAYGPRASSALDNSSGFDCRFAVPSPCPGSGSTGHWSEHAYGEAIDLNPIENPYVGCGRTRPRASLPYVDRSRLRRGMVTPAVVGAFRTIGWGWGGAWSGPVKDYMHFSASGH
jgi:hypothetical protein